MAMATSAASHPRALLPGASLPRARFGAADLRVRDVLVFAFALPMGSFAASTYYDAIASREGRDCAANYDQDRPDAPKYPVSGLRLHGYWRSSASYRVRIALESKGHDFEYVPAHLARSG